jgi:hypothetical protein
VVDNSAALQQEGRNVRLNVYNKKIILVAMYLQRVGIDGLGYAAAPTQVLAFHRLFEPPRSDQLSLVVV